eukprot:UN00597
MFHQKSLRQKLSLHQKLLNTGEQENANIKPLDAAFLTPFQPAIKSIFIDAVIAHTFTSILASDKILQKSLHQKAEATAIDLTLENVLIPYQKSLHQKLLLQPKLNYDEHNEKEKVNKPQLAAVLVAPNFGDGDQTPSLDVLTGVQFSVGSLLLPIMSFPAPRSIPDGNIVLGGGSGGAVVIRGGSFSLHLNVLGIAQRLYLFQIMLCVMLINNDCYAYFLKFIKLRLLYILSILCTLTVLLISIVCFVFSYFINDKILIIKRGLKVPHNLFCFRISHVPVAHCSGNIIYVFIILLL